MKDSRGRLYCALCWQEFEHPREHGAGSFDHERKRLNGHCPGQIRVKPENFVSRGPKAETPSLDLDSAEPLIVK